MDFLFNFVNNVNWEAVAQLTMLGLIVLAGPAVIFLLAARRGDL